MTLPYLKSTLAAALLLGSQFAAQADVLYTNGPINGDLNAFELYFAISDSFTLKSDSYLTGVDFGAYTDGGARITSIGWGITSDPTDYSLNGTADVAETDVFTNRFGWDVGTASFALPGVALEAGTYYLVLKGPATTDGGFAYWDENDGPSSASVEVYGDLADFDVPNSTGSESFRILGTSAVDSAVIEPAPWAFMIVGFGAIGFTGRRGRKLRQAV